MRLPCTHKGTYADDCLLSRAKQHRCYIVATCDTDLRKRVRQVRAFRCWGGVLGLRPGFESWSPPPAHPPHSRIKKETNL